MTEQVQKRMELMTEELEEMARTNLFTIEETRTVMKKRREYEYKIHSLAKDLKSYTDYINFEKCLLKDIRLRRDKYRIAEKKGSIEHKIIKRVKVLYEVAMQRFPNEIPLFLCYLKFCKKVNYVAAATEAVANIVKVKKHPNDPNIWLIASNWHRYDRKDPNTASMILLKALSIHKSDRILLKESLNAEIQIVTDNTESNEKQSELHQIGLKRVEAIMTQIYKEVKLPSFFIEILELLEKHHFTITAQDTVVEHLLKHYSNDENVWHALAQRERRGVGESGSSGTAKRTPKARFEACFAKYKQGLTVVKPETKQKLWNLYLDFLLELQQDNFVGATVLKMETLKASLNEACEGGYLSEKYFLAWIEITSEKEALEVAEKGTLAIPQSVELWKARLRLQIFNVARCGSHEVDKVFKMGIKALKENSLPLWSSIIRYHYLSSSDDLIQLIFEDGIKQAREISDTLKPQYIEWLTLTRGIESAREVYKRLAGQTPYCKEFHSMMSKLESIQIDYEFKFWEQIHKNACEQFGKDDVDVWIDHIRFYLHFNKNIPNLNERVQTISSQAQSTLQNSLVFEYHEKFKTITSDI